VATRSASRGWGPGWRIFALALLAGLWTLPLAAGADDNGEPVRFEYGAPATCPARDAFIAEVRARTSRARLAQEGEQARRFHVSLAWTEAGAEGTLVVTDLALGTSRRVVDGDSCSAVASALALVVALTIDPSAATGPLPLAAAAAGAPPVPPIQVSPVTVPLSSPPPPSSNTAPLSHVLIEEPHASRVRLDLAAHVSLAVFGAGSPLGSVFGSAIGGSVALDRRTWLAPELRVGFSYAGSDSPNVPDGYARFTWWRAELEVCPLRLLLARTLDLRPCAFGRAGALVSAGHGLDSSVTSTRPWGELGASALVEWRVMGPLALEVEMGADVPLLRETFGFQDPSDSLYQPPGVMAEGRFGLGVHFP